MTLWFDETYEGRVRFGLKVTRSLFHGRSEYQEIDVVETAQFGKVLALDGVFQTSIGDEFHYHEMLVHPALTTAPNIRRVLVIGGGDGGSVREVLKYSEVQDVTLCELDEMVVRACQEHLSEFQVPWEDSRLTMVFRDGVAFLKEQTEPFDVILVDGPDPVGPAAGLFQSPFYEVCKKSLSAGGVLAIQSEAPQLMSDEFVRIAKSLRNVFPKARPYFAPVPIYMSGSWGFGYASESADHLAIDEARAAAVEPTARYYSREIHRAAFAVPSGLKRQLEL